jgi:lipoate-protein ligase A
MGHAFRLFNTGFHSAFYNMGLDQALLESVSAGKSIPCLRFYGWEPRAVSIGYFQGLEEEVNVPACREQGVDIVRRLTGGGAVFHHAELTYSMILPLDHPLAASGIRASYEILCRGIVAGLLKLGVKAAFVPVNDIECGGKKISGNAQTRKKGALLQHGTVLLESDTERMFELLKVPPEKLKGKIIAGVKQRVTSLEEILGRQVPFEEAAAALEAGFKEALDLDFSLDIGCGAIGEDEEKRALDLARNHLSSDQWIRARP